MTEQLPKLLSPWTAEDLKQWQQLDEYLGRKVTWNVSTPELVNVYRSLVWFAQLKDKIRDSQAEIVAVHEVKDVRKKGK